MGAEVLGLVALRVALAGRDEQVAVAREDEARSEVMVALELRLLAEDDLEVGELPAVEPRARDRRAVGPVRVPARRTTGRSSSSPRSRGSRITSSRPPWPSRMRPPARRRSAPRARRRGATILQAPGTLGDEHAAVRQEGERPRMLEPVRHGRDRDLRLAARRHVRRVLARARPGDREQQRQETALRHRADPRRHALVPVRRRPRA